MDDGENPTIVVERLCGKLFLITDKDDASNPAKVARHEKLKAKLGDRYVCLESREIENLLTPKVIGAIVTQYEGENTELNEFSQDDYKTASLGEFIESKVLKTERKRKASYMTESGTITDKVNFCHKAIEEIKSFGDISPEGKELTKKIYSFIQKHNN